MKEQMTSWLDSIVSAIQNTFQSVISFIPNVLAALVVILLFNWLGRWVGSLIEKLLNKINLAEKFPALDFTKYVEPLGLRSIQHLFGKLVHLFIFLVALLAAADILNLPQVTGLLNTILLFVPKAIVALLILVVGVGAAKLSDSFLKGEFFEQVPALKGLVRFVIVTFAFLAALNQFEVSPRLIEILFAGVVFAMAIGTGLAFGLGGKEAAKDLLDRLRRKG